MKCFINLFWWGPGLQVVEYRPTVGPDESILVHREYSIIKFCRFEFGLRIQYWLYDHVLCIIWLVSDAVLCGVVDSRMYFLSSASYHRFVIVSFIDIVSWHAARLIFFLLSGNTTSSGRPYFFSLLLANVHFRNFRVEWYFLWVSVENMFALVLLRR